MELRPNSEPRMLKAATVLLMLLSVSCMLLVGLRSESRALAPVRPAPQGLSHSIRSNQGGHMGALRGRITRWVTYLARSG
jgi:hypothetical protein